MAKQPKPLASETRTTWVFTEASMGPKVLFPPGKGKQS